MKYFLPTKIVIGKLEEEIKRELRRFKPIKILLVTGGKAMEKSGVIGKMLELLSDYQILRFNEVESNPSPATVKKAKKNCDLVIGLGGGSVMDVAKVAATELKKPYIAIPTTAGTGSEVTPFAALYDKEKKKKLSLDVNFPDVALIDYRLTLTMSPGLIATTGMDALSQAVEAYWSIYSNIWSDFHSERAIRLVMNNLLKSWRGDQAAKKNMSLAALEAGMAFSQTKTTAPHAVSYPLSIHYGIPHGLACGLTLPHFLTYNYKVSKKDCLDKRGEDFVKTRIRSIASFLGGTDVEGGKKAIINLMESLNLPLKVDFDEDIVIKEGFAPERMANNPRRVTEAGLREILIQIKKRA